MYIRQIYPLIVCNDEHINISTALMQYDNRMYDHDANAITKKIDQDFEEYNKKVEEVEN